MQNLGDPLTQIFTWLAKAIDDLAQMGFINTQHFSHPVLAKAACINSQLQIWVNIAMNGHSIYLEIFRLGTGFHDLLPADYEYSNQ